MVTLSQATVSDLDQLVHLENTLFLCDRISPRQFRYLLTKAKGIVIKAMENTTVLGYMVLLWRRTSTKLRLYSIAVITTARKLGIARQLLEFAEQLAASKGYSAITLEVCESNKEAIGLYTKTGFGEFGQKTGYYEDGCSAKLFSKHIQHH